MKYEHIVLIVFLAILIIIPISYALYITSEPARIDECKESCSENGFIFYNYLKINRECWCDNPNSNISVLYIDEK